MLPDRITKRVVEHDGHWMWTGTKQKNGYGYTGWDVGGKRKNVRVHRLFYETFVGPIPEDLEIDHICQVKLCVNPLHLRAVTHQENLKTRNHRGPAKKTHCKRGHEFTAENTYWSKGFKNCRTCRTEAVRRWRASP